MRFLFWPDKMLPFHGESLVEKPMGGMETAVIRFSNALAELGHDVTVLTKCEKVPRTPAHYVHFSKYSTIPALDAIFAVRSWEPLFAYPHVPRRFFWTGDTPTTKKHVGLGDTRVYAFMEKALFVSEWQADAICTLSGLPREKTHILRNGVDLREFSGSEERHPRRLIYASNPQRGLQQLIPIFRRLKEKYPNLELHIFSNAALYDMRWPPRVGVDKEAKLFLKRVATIPGCFVRGTMPQPALAREYMKSSILVYPCNCIETSCITIMEAQAAGCAVVTSDHGALKETVGEAGICIPGDPGTPDFDGRFESEVDRLIADRNYWESMSAKALVHSRSIDWQARARDFVRYFERDKGTPGTPGTPLRDPRDK